MMGTSQVDAVLQPSPTALGGEFLFSKRSVFNLSHIVRPCVNGSVLSPTDMCDQLLMTTLGDITESGCFTIQYRPAGRSPLIQTQVIYGKSNILLVRSVCLGAFQLFIYGCWMHNGYP